MKTKSLKTILFVALLGVCACDSGSHNNPGPADMAMMVQSNADMAMTTQGNPDMVPVCGTNPMTQTELLNACTDSDFVDKTPFYPTLAPNGQLPPLP